MISDETTPLSADIPEEEYTAEISRGGLSKPSDILLVTAVHAWVMWCFIRDHKETKDMFTKSKRTWINEVTTCRKVHEWSSLSALHSKNHNINFQRLFEKSSQGRELGDPRREETEESHLKSEWREGNIWWTEDPETNVRWRASRGKSTYFNRLREVQILFRQAEIRRK